jgi:F420H(2)-dependent quinone reductase
MTIGEQPAPLPMAEPVTPPIPGWAYGIVNPTMSFILRSPMHGLLSKQLMLLIYEGRRTGKRYSIPVGYTRDGNRLTLFSHAKWARNFEGGYPVAVRLEGELRPATARIITDHAVIRRAIEQMVSRSGEGMATRMGFIAPGPDGAPRLQLPQGTTFVEIALS